MKYRHILIILGLILFSSQDTLAKNPYKSLVGVWKGHTLKEFKEFRKKNPNKKELKNKKTEMVLIPGLRNVSGFTYGSKSADPWIFEGNHYIWSAGKNVLKMKRQKNLKKVPEWVQNEMVKENIVENFVFKFESCTKLGNSEQKCEPGKSMPPLDLNTLYVIFQLEAGSSERLHFGIYYQFLGPKKEKRVFQYFGEKVSDSVD